MKVVFELDDDYFDESVDKFVNTSIECCKLYAKKNADYGNSFAKGVETIGNMYAVGRIYDKVNRLITLSKDKNKNPNFESLSDTLKDLACYSIMFYNELTKKDESIKA